MYHRPPLWHDLESFFWVLLWVVVLYTDHELGQEYSSKIFTFGHNRIASSDKWRRLIAEETSLLFFEPPPVYVHPSNEPLRWLMDQYRVLVKKQYTQFRGRDEDAGIVLTYADVQELFETALAMESWPMMCMVHRHRVQTPHRDAMRPATRDSTCDRDATATLDPRSRPRPRPRHRHRRRARDRDYDLRANPYATHSPRRLSTAPAASADDRKHLKTSPDHDATDSRRCATARAVDPHSRRPDSTPNTASGARHLGSPRASADELTRTPSSLAPFLLTSPLRLLLFLCVHLYLQRLLP